jgi:hypothetical protein
MQILFNYTYKEIGNGQKGIREKMFPHEQLHRSIHAFLVFVFSDLSLMILLRKPEKKY